MKPLFFHPDVALDVKGSYNWYERELNGLGNGFISELENAYVYAPVKLGHRAGANVDSTPVTMWTLRRSTCGQTSL